MSLYNELKRACITVEQVEREAARLVRDGAYDANDDERFLEEAQMLLEYFELQIWRDA